MNVHIAGVFSAGNLRGGQSAILERGMNIYLAQVSTRPYVAEQKDMDIFSAGNNGEKGCIKNLDTKLRDKVNILESFFYLRKNENYMNTIKLCKSFLLDSGAFTFMSDNSKSYIDWDKYVEDYAAFVVKWDVKLFFELDIDSIVGIKEVERLRDKLEALTGRKCIPVWHKSRGKEYFEWMVKNYSYVAIGGIVTKEIPRQTYEKLFPWFIRTAHANGCKIHGLGYTSVLNLTKYRFDSVDSTAWISGNMGGYIMRFNPKECRFDKFKKEGSKLKGRAAAEFNFKEWIKFSEYAERYL